MATIISYTTVEQSCKLAEFLSIESADYHYIAQGEKSYFYPYSLSSDAIKHYDENIKYIPCWSLTSLLNAMPFPVLYMEMVAGMISWCCECHFMETDEVVKIEHYDNQVNACVAMIEKLNELDLL